MFSANTALTIYYRTGETGSQDTISFTFLSNSSCARFTAFDHNDYLDASSEFQAQINGNTSLGAEKFYLQGMGGIKAQLLLPDIQEFFDDGPVAINEAKLVLHINDDGNGLDPALKLALVMIDEEGDAIALPDALESSSYFGGEINDGETQYFFRISRHVQQILTGETPNYPLHLSVSGASFRPERVILHGSDELINGDMRMTLNVIYTKVN